MMVEIQNTVVSLDILTEYFCCDYETCKGACCVEGDAGAPVEEEEIAVLEEAAEKNWDRLTRLGRKQIDAEGVVYIDKTGDLVTSIVNNRDCVFAQRNEKGQTYCTIQSCKPISCALYPIRLSKMGDYTALNYHRWDICRCARELGKAKGIRVYQFLKEPLVRRFGEEWYEELTLVAQELERVPQAVAATAGTAGQS